MERSKGKTVQAGVYAYRSRLEEKVAKQLTLSRIAFEYETKACKFNYTIPLSNHIYTCDFVITTRTGRQIFIEAKGIWDYDDRNKHRLIRQQLPWLDIRFVFQRAKSKIRKGSKATYADICEGKGRGVFKDLRWKYGDNGTIPKEWYNE